MKRILALSTVMAMLFLMIPGTAFDFGDDEYLWFIDSAVYETMYRYRDLK